MIVLPAGPDPLLEACRTSVLYWVHDAPLLRYLGVKPSGARFRPCHYPASRLDRELHHLMEDPGSARSNRLSLSWAMPIFRPHAR